MPKLKIFTSQKKTIYRPATIKKHKAGEWYCVYFLQDQTGSLKRIRKRVKHITPKRDRELLAQKIKDELNQKMILGWNPLLNVNDKHISNHHLLKNYLLKYLKNVEKRYMAKELRYDSYRTYKSYVKIVCKYIDKHCPKLALKDYDKTFIIRYLEHLRLDCNKTPRYSNNLLSFFKTFSFWLMDREHLASNPTRHIKALPKEKKQREIIPEDKLKLILEDIEQHNKRFYLICLLTYICFIRRTELTKLKVKDIDFEQNIIIMRSEVSKNKKHEYVTLPDFLIEKLKAQIKSTPKEHYIFSTDFKPGTKILYPKKINNTWTQYRDKLKLKKTYHFYSLKDTGITKLFFLKLPLIKIRDQARHYDIKITESYTPRLQKADEEIKHLKYF